MLACSVNMFKNLQTSWKGGLHMDEDLLDSQQATDHLFFALDGNLVKSS